MFFSIYNLKKKIYYMKIEQPYQLYREVGMNIIRLCKEIHITQAELAFRCDMEGPNIN